jgi:signal transduction histidine kinase
VLTPHDLTVVAASETFLRAISTTAEAVVGRRFLDLVSSDPVGVDASATLAGSLRDSIARVIATRAPDVMQAQHYGIGPRAMAATTASDAIDRVWIGVNVPVLDERGAVVLIIHALEDATEPQRVQQQLALAVAARDEAMRTSHLKTRLLGMISHELRTPLTALSLQVERMQRNAAELANRHQESLERIASSAGRLREMIETLLEYARIESGHVSVNPESFDLCDSLRKAVAHHRHEAEQRGLEIRCWLRDTPAVVVTDRRLVDLVMSNLVDNAIKFTPSGTIDVALERSPDGDHRVAVTDTGPGIALALQKKIFEPFEQLGPGRRPLVGIGLGLALVRDIAGALGGRIELVSEPNVGSTFTFVLPAAAARRTRAGHEPAQEPAQG